MRLEKMHWVGVGAGVLLAVASVIFFGGNIRFFFLIISLVFGALPFVVSLMLMQGRQKEKEEKFLAFTRDLVEMVKSGTPISKSIANLRGRNYGPLSKHIDKLANQLALGLTLHEALGTFARDTKSRVIARAVGLISEAEKAGGDISTVLSSVAMSVNQIEILRKERNAAVSNLVVQGYLIFLVFIIIMLVLQYKILPLISDLSGGENGLSVEIRQLDPSTFSMPMFVMLLVQSLFAGLVIGKISEGTIKDGIKHSFILLGITLLVTTGAGAIFG